MRSPSFLLIPFILVLLVGCTGSGNPLEPVETTVLAQDGENMAERSGESNRLFLGFWEISVSEDHKAIEIVPYRSADMHLNVTRMLEGGACDDCLTISNIQVPSPGELWLDLTIRHPFEGNLALTCFDPRAILVSDSDFTFPIADRDISLDGSHLRLLNPDGYTSLFNSVEFPEDSPLPPVFKYWTGKYSTGGSFSATLNPFIAYCSEVTRRMFLPGSEETETVKLGVPAGGFQFGYAIDVSWVLHDGEITDPETDFPLEANCLEPYKLTLDIPDPLVSLEGDSTPVYVEVFDHQGLGGIGDVTVEIPGIWDGVFSLSFSHAAGEDIWLYDGIITNELGAGPGEYPVLVKTGSIDSDPNLGELTAYNIFNLEIVENGLPVAIAEYEPSPQYINGPVHFYDDGSYDPDGGSIVGFEWDWENDGVYDDEGNDIHHSWDLPGTYLVQFRVTDDEGTTDELDEPLAVEIIDPVGSFIDVVPDKLNVGRGPLWCDGDCLAIGRGRGLDLYHITDPLNPVWVKSFDDILTVYLNHAAFRDNYLFVISTSVDPELVIFDVTDVTNPIVINKVDLLLEDAGSPLSIALKDNYAYIGTNEPYGLLFVDIETPETATLTGFLDLMAFCYTIDFYGEYTIIGQGGMGFQKGVQVWDIDPPDQAEFITGFDTSTVYKIVSSDGYVYTSGSHPHAYIFDIDPIEEAAFVKGIPSLGIFDVEVEGDYLYAGVLGGWGIFDIDPPEDANLVKSIEMPKYSEFTALGDGYAYMCAHLGLYVIDIDPVESADIVNSIYSTLLSSYELEKSGDILYLTSHYHTGASNDGFLEAVDVSDPMNPEVISMTYLPNGYCEVELDNGHAFAVGHEKLQVVDISTPGSEFLVVEFPISGESYDIDIEGNFAYIANKHSLLICDISNPDSPSISGNVPYSDTPMMVEAGDEYAFVVVYEDGLTTYFAVVDINPPDEAHEVIRIPIEGGLSTFYTLASIASSGSYVYVNTYNKFNVVNVTNPESPELVQVIDFMDNQNHTIQIVGDLAYLLGTDGLRIVDISVPEEAYVINLYESVTGKGFMVDSDYIYTACSGFHVYMMD